MRRWGAAAVLLVLCLALVAAAGIQFRGLTQAEGRLKPLVTTILKVGKADAIVLTDGAHTMVIDAGEEEDGEELVAFLEKQGISAVDVLVITHYDRDHVGGADTLVESVEIGRVLVPDYDGASAECLDFVVAMDQRGITSERLREPVDFNLGDAEVHVEPPPSYEMVDGTGEIDNNLSLVTTVVHGENRLLFAGDIEKQRIRQWLSQGNAVHCDFLKVPHHGVYNTALEALFDAVQPKCAAICSSAKNPADVRTTELLRAIGCDVRETKDGRISVVSDGVRLEMRQKIK